MPMHVPFTVPCSIDASAVVDACPWEALCPGDMICRSCENKGCMSCFDRCYKGDDYQCTLTTCGYCNLKHKATYHDMAEARRVLAYNSRQARSENPLQGASGMTRLPTECRHDAKCSQCGKPGCAACLGVCPRWPECNWPECSSPECNCDGKICMDCHDEKHAATEAKLRTVRLLLLNRSSDWRCKPKAPPPEALHELWHCDMFPPPRRAGPYERVPLAKPYKPGGFYPPPDESLVPGTHLSSRIDSASQMRSGERPVACMAGNIVSPEDPAPTVCLASRWLTLVQTTLEKDRMRE